MPTSRQGRRSAQPRVRGACAARAAAGPVGVREQRAVAERARPDLLPPAHHRHDLLHATTRSTRPNECRARHCRCGCDAQPTATASAITNPTSHIGWRAPTSLLGALSVGGSRCGVLLVIIRNTLVPSGCSASLGARLCVCARARVCECVRTCCVRAFVSVSWSECVCGALVGGRDGVRSRLHLSVLRATPRAACASAHRQPATDRSKPLASAQRDDAPTLGLGVCVRA